MWLLISQRSPDVQYELLAGKEYSIGRKDCDITLESDMSLSRKHAVLKVLPPEKASVPNVQNQAQLIVKDLSKLGTLVGETRIQKAESTVRNGTGITFGTAGISKFKAVYEAFCVTTSCLESADKRRTKQLVARVGGSVVSEWRKSCQLLVMSSLSITIKAICALIQQKPIVTSQYLDKYIDAIENRKPKPKPEAFLPPLAESQLDPALVSFKANPKREILLQGKIFIFLTPKQFKKLSVAVELAGGTPILMEEGTDDNEEDILTQPGSCVMSCDMMDQSQSLTQNAEEWVSHVMEVLLKHSRRAIQECEIGYAVLYSSIAVHCNPEADLASQAAQPLPPQTVSQLVPGAPSPDKRARPETGTHGTASQRVTARLSQIQVKQEILSQKDPSQQPLRSSRTKRFDMETTYEASGEVPGAGGKRKSGASATAVKDEPTTPWKATTDPEVIRSPPRSRLKLSPRAATATASRDAAATASRDEVATASRDEVATASRGVATGEARAGHGGGRTRGGAEDGSPPRDVRRSPRHSASRSPSPAPATSATPVKSSRQRATAGSVAMETTPPPPEVDALPVTRDTAKATAKTERKSAADQIKDNRMDDDMAESPNKDGDLFASVPKRKRRRDRPGSELTVVGSETQARGQTPAGSLTSKTRDAGDRRPLSQEASGTEVKTERQVAPADNDIIVSDSDDEKMGGVVADAPSDGAPIPGFLSSMDLKKEIGAQPRRVPRDPDEASLPARLLQCREESLLARQPGRAVNKEPTTIGDTCLWKGKTVKNFKKFRKVDPESAGLPCIIGGCDLVAHETNSGKNQELFDEYFEAESQKEKESSTKDIFDVGHIKKRRY